MANILFYKYDILRIHCEIHTFLKVVSNYDQWIYNISEANENKNKSPRWYKLYSFKDAYGVNSMDYEAFHNITENMKNDKTNRTLLKQYYR